MICRAGASEQVRPIRLAGRLRAPSVRVTKSARPRLMQVLVDLGMAGDCLELASFRLAVTSRAYLRGAQEPRPVRVNSRTSSRRFTKQRVFRGDEQQESD
jgi:hypothetical protein